MARHQYNQPKALGLLNRCSCWGAIVVAAIVSGFMGTPLQAAERIHFQYGPFGFSVTRQDLEQFAETGTMAGTLKMLLSQTQPEFQQQLRLALQARYEVDPVLANRFSYTSSGQQLLQEIGTTIQTESRQNGFYALRSALTLAALDPDGLTILNFVKHLPTNLYIDVKQALALASELQNLLAETRQIVWQMAEETDQIADSESEIDFTALENPKQSGDWPISKQTLRLYDRDRDRDLVVDLYIPQSSLSRSPRPIIAISNGLGAKRSRFEKLARHLTSHGFAVVIPEHPGSDRQRLREFYEGLHRENFAATEYVDRPLDISFLLDELARLNSERFGNRLDPDRVGVFGYSFGGTTALALAGAEIDLTHLQQACVSESGILNISLLYQCRALELSSSLPKLSDERIQAIYAFVPFSRSIYGPQGLAQVNKPVFWEAAEQDILTPLAIEQIPAFSWLPENRDRYLAVTSGLPHARLTLNVLNRLTNQNIAWEEIEPIAETYHQMLSLVFFQVHLKNNEAYRPYLGARGIQYLEEKPYRINWRGGNFHP
ncbi:alpha/beta hydrolase [Spirulina sp. 06S082]|uniref:alpha/beta hydrolase n=1 Tax=Spirulina sp. 06S082 TaxID=3110248 RepID=UPI002B21F5AD|nr:alpha/beta fold hydrolase [Spirulina sp. 06S082]MEA5471095.1 alpha/beta fold hydrolase [Spirulina sp. 06S082]